jgi:hypothetical protein
LKTLNKIALFFLVILGFSFSKPMTGPIDTFAKFKALYIYNFPKYFEWPEDYQKGSFVIGVIGASSATTAELNKIIQDKSVGEQKLEIKSFATPESITKCQMLLVNSDKSDLLPKIVAKLKGKSTLVISEKEGAIKSGSIINFVIKDSKQKFELSVNNAEKSSLRVSKTLLPLAIEVN